MYPPCDGQLGANMGNATLKLGLGMEMHPLFRESPPRGFCITSPAS